MTTDRTAKVKEAVEYFEDIPEALFGHDKVLLALARDYLAGAIGNYMTEDEIILHIKDYLEKLRVWNKDTAEHEQKRSCASDDLVKALVNKIPKGKEGGR